MLPSKKYEKKTGQDLQTHPLAAELDRCHSIDGVLDIFQKQVDALDGTAKRGQTLMKWLKPYCACSPRVICNRRQVCQHVSFPY
jgi:hypothetical protein